MNNKWFEQLPIDNIKNVTPMSGGDVNDAYRIEGKKQTYFLLVQPNQSKEFFTNEVSGLKDLKEAGITVPEVYNYGDIDGDAYLLISFLEKGSGSQRELGKMVAKMHSHYSDNGKFGYDHQHQGGDYTLSNEWTDSWIELFVVNRLDELRNEIMKDGKWKQKQDDRYQQARSVMVGALSQHESKPSLLHGDLWGGNHMFLTDGTPALFDPSTFYGDREFDIGITTGFGGYSQEFYDAYQEAYPLEEGANHRLAFYRLYLFMVHLYKFGGIYEQSVDRTIEEIISNAP